MVTSTAEMAARRGSSMTHPMGSNSPSPEFEVEVDLEEDVLVADPSPPVVVEGTPGDPDFAAADSASSDSNAYSSSIKHWRSSYSPQMARLTIDILIVTRLRELVRVFFNVRTQILGQRLVPFLLTRFGLSIDGT